MPDPADPCTIKLAAHVHATLASLTARLDDLSAQVLRHAPDYLRHGASANAKVLKHLTAGLDAVQQTQAKHLAALDQLHDELCAHRDDHHQ